MVLNTSPLVNCCDSWQTLPSALHWCAKLAAMRHDESSNSTSRATVQECCCFCRCPGQAGWTGQVWLPQRCCSTLSDIYFIALYLEAGVHCGSIVATVEGALDGVLRLPCPLLQETHSSILACCMKLLLAGIYRFAITGVTVAGRQPWTIARTLLASAFSPGDAPPCRGCAKAGQQCSTQLPCNTQ